MHEILKNSAPHHEDTVRFSSCMRRSDMEEGRVSKTQRGFYRMGGAGGWLGCMDRRHDKWRQRPWHAAAARRRTHGPSSSLVCNSAAGSNLNTRGYRDTDTTHVPVSTVSTTTGDEIVRWKRVGLVFTSYSRCILGVPKFCSVFCFFIKIIKNT